LLLIGIDIDIASGEWTHRDSGIGSGIDSYFEYLLKAALFFQDQDYLDVSSNAIRKSEKRKTKR
jgi:Glycosyl hydrolase family 47